MDWKFGEIKVGNVARVNMGSYYHYGICTGEDRIIQFGLPVLNPNEKDVEVCATDINTFLHGKFAEIMVLNKKEQKNANNTKTIIEKAEASLGEKGYNLIYNNCEHFANRCVFNVSKSTQIEDFKQEMLNKITPKEIYIAPVESFINNSILPKYTIKELKKITNESVRNQKISAYGLLKYAVEKSFKFDDNFKTLKKTKNGKPFAKNYCLSISHTTELIAVGVSKLNLGIDLEVVDNSKDFNHLEKFIISESESSINPKSIEDLISVWTKKEAQFKFNGDKIYNPKTINSTLTTSKSININYNNKNYILSVVADDVANVKIIDLTKEN